MICKWNIEQHETGHAPSGARDQLSCPTCHAKYDTWQELNAHHNEDHPDDGGGGDEMNVEPVVECSDNFSAEQQLQVSS